MFKCYHSRSLSIITVIFFKHQLVSSVFPNHAVELLTSLYEVGFSHLPIFLKSLSGYKYLYYVPSGLSRIHFTDTFLDTFL